MRFATMTHPRTGRLCGVVSGEQLFPIPDLTVLDLIRRGLAAALELGEHARAHSTPLDVADCRFEAPFRPPTVRDFVTFEEHVEGVRSSMQGATGVPDAWYEAPRFYFTNPHMVSGPDSGVVVPAGCGQLDFELEVAAVVGASGAHLTVTDAAEHIFDYTILNDWSARDLQRREMEVGLDPAKGKDFANTIGPVLVTADEMTDRLDDDGFLTLNCVAEINGVAVGNDVLSNMGWTFPAMIAYASRDSRVEPGDLIGSGTIGNGGCLAELWGRCGDQAPPALVPGDTVTLTVDGIGSLSNTVVARTDRAPAIPPARVRADRAAHRARQVVARSAR
ncbi:fumarylacetoacetate hydrolase family protein [Gordonia sp. NB41Y]|uniref:fumarylacetoacetate hydrolase family protein n=1 Tax=Gordonia sp. NB41Y TaxID=875808 RepID=UPI0002BED1E9|nr:fumarylacetoacetate hydrolase family protein [Gordonia sp. NB41Y]EMP15385.1 hydroxylase [Gordonia sp. NB41Y]WLP90706.1 fumarylacetoacetate hydrolase family protein [Gordonia sp. NB41Y]